MYLYKKDCPGLRKGHKKTKKTIRVGIKQHTRAFQPIPDELRSRVSKPSVSLAMWELKRRKQEKEEEPPAFEWFDGKVRPGRFFHAEFGEKAGGFASRGLRTSRWSGQFV